MNDISNESLNRQILKNVGIMKSLEVLFSSRKSVVPYQILRELRFFDNDVILSLFSDENLEIYNSADKSFVSQKIMKLDETFGKKKYYEKILKEKYSKIQKEGKTEDMYLFNSGTRIMNDKLKIENIFTTQDEENNFIQSKWILLSNILKKKVDMNPNEQNKNVQKTIQFDRYCEMKLLNELNNLTSGYTNRKKQGCQKINLANENRLNVTQVLQSLKNVNLNIEEVVSFLSFLIKYEDKKKMDENSIFYFNIPIYRDVIFRSMISAKNCFFPLVHPSSRLLKEINKDFAKAYETPYEKNIKDILILFQSEGMSIGQNICKKKILKESMPTLYSLTDSIEDISEKNCVLKNKWLLNDDLDDKKTIYEDWFTIVDNKNGTTLLGIRKDIFLMMYSNGYIHMMESEPIYHNICENWHLNSNKFHMIEKIRKYNIIRCILNWTHSVQENLLIRDILPPDHVDFDIYYKLFDVINLWFKENGKLTKLESFEESLSEAYSNPEDNSLLKGVVSMLLIRKKHVVDYNTIKLLKKYLYESTCDYNCACTLDPTTSGNVYYKDKKAKHQCKNYRKRKLFEEIPNLKTVLDLMDDKITLQNYENELRLRCQLGGSKESITLVNGVAFPRKSRKRKISLTCCGKDLLEDRRYTKDEYDIYPSISKKSEYEPIRKRRRYNEDAIKLNLILNDPGCANEIELNISTEIWYDDLNRLYSINSDKTVLNEKRIWEKKYSNLQYETIDINDMYKKWLDLGQYIATKSLYKLIISDYLPTELRKKIFLSMYIITKREIENQKRNKKKENYYLVKENELSGHKEICDLGKLNKEGKYASDDFNTINFKPHSLRRFQNDTYKDNIQAIIKSYEGDVEEFFDFMKSEDTKPNSNKIHNWFWQDNFIFGNVLMKKEIVKRIQEMKRKSSVLDSMKYFLAYIEGRSKSGRVTGNTTFKLRDFLLPDKPVYSVFYNCIKKKTDQYYIFKDFKPTKNRKNDKKSEKKKFYDEINFVLFLKRVYKKKKADDEEDYHINRHVQYLSHIFNKKNDLEEIKKLIKYLKEKTKTIIENNYKAIENEESTKTKDDDDISKSLKKYEHLLNENESKLPWDVEALKNFIISQVKIGETIKFLPENKDYPGREDFYYAGEFYFSRYRQ